MCLDLQLVMYTKPSTTGMRPRRCPECRTPDCATCLDVPNAKQRILQCHSVRKIMIPLWPILRGTLKAWARGNSGAVHRGLKRPTPCLSPPPHEENSCGLSRLCRRVPLRAAPSARWVAVCLGKSAARAAQRQGPSGTAPARNSIRALITLSCHVLTRQLLALRTKQAHQA